MLQVRITLFVTPVTYFCVMKDLSWWKLITFLGYLFYFFLISVFAAT